MKIKKKKEFLNREIRHLVGRAIHLYSLISHGDKISVAVSGGADSLFLLWILNERRKWIPISYELMAIHIDLGFDRGKTGKAIEEFLNEVGIESRVVYTDIGPRAHSSENREKSPCFFCARMRRKEIFQIAHETGFRKIAFGHHRDDLIETFMMNILYSGFSATMVPKQPFFNGLITIIRPLALLDRSKIRRFYKRLEWPIFDNPCPSSEDSNRMRIRRLLQELYRENGKVKGNIFRAMSNYKPEYLPPRV